MIVQDSLASPSTPARRREIVAEGIDIHELAQNAEECLARMHESLETVSLDKEHVGCLPREFSGGQRQRIGMACALAVDRSS